MVNVGHDKGKQEDFHLVDNNIRNTEKKMS